MACNAADNGNQIKQLQIFCLLLGVIPKPHGQWKVSRWSKIVFCLCFVHNKTENAFQPQDDEDK